VPSKKEIRTRGAKWAPREKKHEELQIRGRLKTRSENSCGTGISMGKMRLTQVTPFSGKEGHPPASRGTKRKLENQDLAIASTGSNFFGGKTKSGGKQTALRPQEN
jgi:pyocin large subunit-like protein